MPPPDSPDPDGDQATESRATPDQYAPWLDRARAGDPSATEGLLRQLRPSILRYCLARLGPHRAEDVTQEVCVSVLSALGRYEDRGLPFGAFAFRIAQRRVADAYRSASRGNVEYVADVPDTVDLSSPGPAEVVERRDLAGRARALLDELPPTQREVLLLRVLGGLSAQEAGDALGLTAGNVRVLQHRGLAKLRQLAASLDDTRDLAVTVERTDPAREVRERAG